MNKLIIPIIAVLIIAAGIGGYFVSRKSASPEINSEAKRNIPYYFIAIHNEPHNSEPMSREKIERGYAILKEMVRKANEYNIKLTLMFTPQWADYISENSERMAELESWKKHGHEIAAHHHSIYHGNWDGYTDYTKKEAETQRIKQGKIPPEEYLGTLNDYIKKLKKINPNIHSGCVNEEHDKAEMPDEIIYGTCSGFANYGEPGRRESDAQNPDKGKNEFITVGNYKGIQRKWLTHYQTSTEERLESAKKVITSMKGDVWGSVFHSSKGESVSFYAFIEFLHSIDLIGVKSRTVSQIIDQKLIPEKIISDDLLNEKSAAIGQPSSSGKCGDGICDAKEKADPDLCPTDCKDGKSSKEPIEQPVTPIHYSGSPFGFHPGDAGSYSYIQDLGAAWSRQGQYLIWTWMDSNRDGNYKFAEVELPPVPGTSKSGGKINYDTQWLKVPENIKIVANVCPFRKGGGDFKNSEESEIYQNFVEKTVERYDGDDNYGCALSAPDCYEKGDKQYPAQEVIKAFKKNPIKYWQVCNQLYDACEEDCKNNYALPFAIAQEKTYKGVKTADSSAYVLIAGDSSKDLYPEVFKKLNGKYIDIIDLHRFGKYDWHNPKKDFDYLKASLQSSGFDMSKLRFWITETGTYSGDPVAGRDLPYQSEKQQAEGLVKMHISALSYGIEKIFWAWNIVEGFQRDCGIFDYTGLVYDGCDCVNGKYVCGSDIGYDKGKDVKKLSYYTYKKMVEVLEGSDWDDIQTIQEADGIYIYKFIKNNKPIWVAWNDNEQEKQITISGISSSQVKITEAVPKYEIGKEVTNYNTAFNTETKTVESEASKITLTLKDKPMFVEGR